MPFAIVGANQVIEIRGRKVRGRMYPWGVVEVENPDHCDFIKLRTMLVYVLMGGGLCWYSWGGHSGTRGRGGCVGTRGGGACVGTRGVGGSCRLVVLCR